MSESNFIFYELLEQYMKSHFEQLLENDDHHHLFNMFIAHLLLNYRSKGHANEPMIQAELEQLDRLIDQMLIDHKQSFENLLQTMKEYK